jgi:hypothetical protein
MVEAEKGKEAILPVAKVQEIVKVEHKNIHAALSAFQGDVPVIPMSKEVKIEKGGQLLYKFNYAPLGAIMALINPILAKHGLAVRHELTKDGIECILTHETYQDEQVKTGTSLTKLASGDQSEEFFSTITQNELRSGAIQIKREGDMKDIGGAITYTRRYTLGIVLGIASDEDLDAPMEVAEKKLEEKKTILSVEGHIARMKSTPDKKSLSNNIEYIKKEIARIVRGEEPVKGYSMGYTLEQYKEILAAGEARGVELDALPKSEPTVQVEDDKLKK